MRSYTFESWGSACPLSVRTHPHFRTLYRKADLDLLNIYSELFEAKLILKLQFVIYVCPPPHSDYSFAVHHEDDCSYQCVKAYTHTFSCLDRCCIGSSRAVSHSIQFSFSILEALPLSHQPTRGLSSPVQVRELCNRS
jgi:hypothetical protein